MNKTPSHSPGVRSGARALIAAALATLSLSLVACEDKTTPTPPPTTTGTGGEGGTGGTGTVSSTTSTGGNGDPCANVVPQGLIDKTCEFGEECDIAITLPKTKEEAKALLAKKIDAVTYNGYSMHFDKTVMARAARMLVTPLTVVDAPGYGAIGSLKGVNAVMVDPYQPYKDDGQNVGNCVPNELKDALNANMMADKDHQPIVTSPYGVNASILMNKNGKMAPTPSTFVNGRTQFNMSSMGDILILNDTPDVKASAKSLPDGHVLVDATQTKDDGKGGAEILSKMGFSAQGMKLVPVEGSFGKFLTAEVVDPNTGSFQLTATGINDPLMDGKDQTTVSVVIPESPNLCDGVDPTLVTCDPVTGGKTCVDPNAVLPKCDPVVVDLCEGKNVSQHGICNPVNGNVDCLDGFAKTTDPNDCNACDPVHENYPACDPDVTATSAPVVTTNGGIPFDVYQADFTLEGTTDPDTYTMWISIDGGILVQLAGYVPGSTSWLYHGNIPTIFTGHTYDIYAKDQAGNISQAGGTAVGREG